MLGRLEPETLYVRMKVLATSSALVSGRVQEGTFADDDVWLKHIEGNVIHGMLLSRHTDLRSAYYKVLPHHHKTLDMETLPLVELCDGGIYRRALPGEIVNVSENLNLKPLAEYEIPRIKMGAEYEVWIEISYKVRIWEGRTTWVFTKETRRPFRSFREDVDEPGQRHRQDEREDIGSLKTLAKRQNPRWKLESSTESPNQPKYK